MALASDRRLSTVLERIIDTDRFVVLFASVVFSDLVVARASLTSFDPRVDGRDGEALEVLQLGSGEAKLVPPHRTRDRAQRRLRSDGQAPFDERVFEGSSRSLRHLRRGPDGAGGCQRPVTPRPGTARSPKPTTTTSPHAA